VVAKCEVQRQASLAERLEQAGESRVIFREAVIERTIPIDQHAAGGDASARTPATAARKCSAILTSRFNVAGSAAMCVSEKSAQWSGSAGAAARSTGRVSTPAPAASERHRNSRRERVECGWAWRPVEAYYQARQLSRIATDEYG